MKYFALCLFFLSTLKVNAAHYFVSSSLGSDDRSASVAQNENTPWKSIDKVNASFAFFRPGDVISFRRGDTFYGTINISSSGTSTMPVTFNSYGTGDQPVVSALTAITGWQPAGNNVYTAQNPVAAKTISQLLINGQVKAPGRYPNLSSTNKGYLLFQSANSNTSLTDSRLAAFNFNGGEIVIRKTRWVLDRNTITSQQGGTVSYTSQSGYPADAGYGYFIQNHPATLDQEAEWYYNGSSKTIGIFSPGGASVKNVQASTTDVLVQLQNQSNISFEGITFNGAGQHAFYISNANRIQVNNCNIVNSGRNAFTLSNAEYVTISNCTVDQTNNIAIQASGANHLNISKNKISNTGTLAGMGDGDSGSYEALMISGNDNNIEQNSITNTGYIPITFSGDNVVVKNNFISNYAFVKDDGGGIYTWNNAANASANVNRTITGNIILNGAGAPEGTSNPNQKAAHGIYIDDNAEAVNIDNNTVANCVGNGLYIHNARNLVITRNTIYNNGVQLEMQHDDIAPNSPVANNRVTGNIFFSQKADQPVAEFKTRSDDLAGFGTFSGNYYCRPIDENAVINTLNKINGSYVFRRLDLEGWKALYSKDADSKITARQIQPFVINQFKSVNQFSNGAFNTGSGGLYAYSPANNFVAGWQSSGLDGGTLKLSFSSIAGNNNKGTVIIGVGSVSAGKSYVVSFSIKSQQSSMIEWYLRKSQASYNDISERKLIKADAGRRELKLLFVPSESQADASIAIDVPEQTGSVYIDNIVLREASVTVTNITDSIAFQYNATASAVNFPLKQASIDVTGKGYNSQVTIGAFGSVLLLRGNGLNTVAISQCAGNGTILREQWNNVNGNDLSNNNWQTRSATNSLLTLFEGPTDVSDRYASRISGFVCPPTTGYYTFWIAGDDATELNLSMSADAAQKKRIAYSLSWTGAREWSRYSSQKSELVWLQAGNKYFIEALHKEGDGGDHLSVAWQLPDGTFEGPISGNRLSPATIANTLQTQSIVFEPLADVRLPLMSVFLTATSTAGLPIQYKVISGPATVSGNVLSLQQAGTIVIEASQPGNNEVATALPVVRSLVVLPLSGCEATGEILAENWFNVPGNNIWNLDWNTPPSLTKLINVFETPENIADNYGTRIRGYLCPPASGIYTFWIAGDDATELYLSADGSVQGKVKIAYTQSWTGRREWDRFSTQKSVAVYLKAGNKYYVEALQKEGGGGDHLSVAWQLPDGTFEGPISGNRLSPATISNALQTQSIAFEPLADVRLPITSVLLTATSTAGLAIQYKVISGPATVSGNVLSLQQQAGTIVIEASQPGNSEVATALPVVRSLVVLPIPECEATGEILAENWLNVPGNNIWNLDWNTPPSLTKLINVFETPENIADNYGTRIRGYLCPPATGLYTFWIAGDDATELYLSADGRVQGKAKIAYAQSWTGRREWNKFSTQKSATIYLKAGNKYYVEALQKEGSGGDHLSVAWQLPDGTFEGPINGNRLSPFKIFTAGKTASGVGGKSVVPAIGDQFTFKLRSNPVKNEGKLFVRINKTEKVYISLVDVQGKRISELYNGIMEGSKLYVLPVIVGNYTPGMYVIQLIRNGESRSLKLIVVD